MDDEIYWSKHLFNFIETAIRWSGALLMDHFIATDWSYILKMFSIN